MSMETRKRGEAERKGNGVYQMWLDFGMSLISFLSGTTRDYFLEAVESL